MPITLDSFVSLVTRSELLEERALNEALAEFRKTGPADEADARPFAEFLCRRDLLTAWQASKLLQGKHRGYTLGRYRLLSLLGKGGMSSVYLAEHMVMRRRCAVKVLPTRNSKNVSYLNRFHREARAVAALDHPNIVRAYDVDQATDGALEIHFLVMEYVPGKTLFEVVKLQGPMPVPKAVDYIRQAALGLGHAHQTGLIHRDVKPENLIVDKQGTLKVMDLGLARFFESNDEQLTVQQDERVLGTANYCSPEQAIDSHEVDARTDIYSLGCTLYYLLMGHPPFSTGTLAQRLIAHQTKEPPAIETKRPDVAKGLVAVVRRMMSKDPGGRFQSMDEVVAALDALTLAAKAAPAQASDAAARSPAADAGTPADQAPDGDAFAFPDLEALSRTAAERDTDSSLEDSASSTEPSPIELFFTQLSDPVAASDSTVLSQEFAGTADPAEFSAASSGPGANSSDRAEVSRSAERHALNRKRRTVPMAAGIIAVSALLAAVAWMFLPPGHRRPRLSGSEREVVVGDQGHFATIGEALKAMATTALKARTIKVAAHHVGQERIVLDGTRDEALVRGLRIVGDSDARAVLRPLEPGAPILQIINATDLTIEGLDFDATGEGAAIELSGFLVGTRLRGLVIRGFRNVGIDGRGLNGFQDQQCTLDSLEFRNASATAVAIRLRAAPELHTAELDVRDCRFIGPFVSSIEFIGDAWNVSIERCIFHESASAVRFAESDQDLQSVSLLRNTFSECQNGVLFAGAPVSDAGLTIARNLFLGQKQAEVLVASDFTPEQTPPLSPANEGFEFNWSDRDVPDEPPKGRVDIFQRNGKRGITAPRFASTDPDSPRFLKPVGDGLRIQSGNGDNGFVGALDP